MLPDQAERIFHVYITASRPRGVLYVGMTSDLPKRAWQHRERVLDGFTKSYWVGRIVYLNDDALHTLVDWIKVRKYPSPYLFYGLDTGPLCYEAARAAFIRCLEKAGLTHKGYTLHCLRHTYASELLNAGMPLQCLQELLGHRCIEMTRRYARLTDNTRREAYYQAMGLIEAGEINGHYQFDYPLPKIAQTA